MVDKDVVVGDVKQAEGQVQENVGKATGSTEDEIAGKAKQAVGAVQEQFGKAKDAVHDALHKDQV